MKQLTISLILAILLFTNCSSHDHKETGKFDTGNLDSNRYTNSFFGLAITISEPWVIVNKNDLVHTMNERIELLQSENKIAKKPATEFLAGISMLLSLTTDTVEKIPLILISSANLDSFPSLRNESDFLKGSIESIKNSYADYDLEFRFTEIKKEKINNKQFYSVETTIRNDSFLAFQKIYSLKRGNRLLNIMVNYNSKENHKQSEEVLSKIIWK